MKKHLRILLVPIALLYMYNAFSQNLLLNSDFETQGKWIVAQGDTKRPYTVDFGVPLSGVQGGSGKVLEITFVTSAGTGEAEVFVFQKFKAVKGKTYKFSAAMKDLSTTISDGWIDLFWFPGNITDGKKIEEISVAKFGTWEGAAKATGFNGLVELSEAANNANKVPTSYFHIPDTIKTDSVCFGINIGTWGTTANFDLIFDNVTVVDSATSSTSISSIKVENLLNSSPNPFSTIANIKYIVTENGNVKVKVFNMVGAEVANLVNEYKIQGSYDVEFNASRLSSGIYICKLEVNGINTSKKMLLVK